MGSTSADGFALLRAAYQEPPVELDQNSIEPDKDTLDRFGEVSSDNIYLGEFNDLRLGALDDLYEDELSVDEDELSVDEDELSLDEDEYEASGHIDLAKDEGTILHWLKVLMIAGGFLLFLLFIGVSLQNSRNSPSGDGHEKLDRDLSGSAPPPEAVSDKIVSLTGVFRTHGDNKEGGQVYLEFRNGALRPWKTPIGNEKEFNDPRELSISNFELALDLSTNPQVVISLEERPPEWTNISWQFDIDVTFASRDGKKFRFQRNNIVLDAAGRTAEAVVAPVP